MSRKHITSTLSKRHLVDSLLPIELKKMPVCRIKLSLKCITSVSRNVTVQQI